MFLSLIPLMSGAQEMIVNESGDTLVILRGSDVTTINKAFLDLGYTKKELGISDSIISSQRKSINTLDSLDVLKDKQLGIYKEELRKEKKKKTRVGFFSGGLGILVGIIIGLVI